ncbi:MAG: hypothetical protein UDH96_08850 [Megasphaera elsdenii]|nr:hypothetical protein [Megasphaera elsdenii]
MVVKACHHNRMGYGEISQRAAHPLLSVPAAILRLPLVGTRWAGKALGRPLRS